MADHSGIGPSRAGVVRLEPVDELVDVAGAGVRERYRVVHDMVYGRAEPGAVRGVTVSIGRAERLAGYMTTSEGGLGTA